MPSRTKKQSGNGPVVAAEEDTAMEDAPTSAQPVVAESQENVQGAQEDGLGEHAEEEEEDEEEEGHRVKILPGSTPYAASFEFIEEGHTLGNALRYIIMKNPAVEFCAYAIPHPSEEKMNIRIQTYGEMTASEALAKGLEDLEDLCDVVAEEFWTGRNNFVEAERSTMVA